MARPNKIPQQDELVELLEANPGLTYPQIIDKYGWEVKANTLRGAARRAGYRRYGEYMKGDGPLSPEKMSHTEFWGKVEQTMQEKAAALRAAAERGSSGSVRQVRRRHRSTTKEWADI